MLDMRYYVTASGESPFAEWFAEQDVTVSAKIVRALARIEQGNLSNVKSVGEGVLEFRIDFGPGYRIYFGRDGETIIILLTGGTKKRQQRDIDAAHAYWQDYSGASAGESERRRDDGKDKELQGPGAGSGQGRQEIRRGASSRGHRCHAERRCRYRQGDPARLHQGDRPFRRARRSDR